MYKFLLCWRYFRTRWIALASIISVMLGVATMIVVNSVMAGFSHEMQYRLRSNLSDVTIERYGMEAFSDPEAHMEMAKKAAGQYIEAMAPAVMTPAMLSYRVMGRWVPRPVSIVGIDPKMQGKVSGFADFLQHPKNREELSFELQPGGYDVRDHQAGDEALDRPQMQNAGWPYRKMRADRDRAMQSQPLADNSLAPMGPGEQAATENSAASNEASKSAANSEEAKPSEEESEPPRDIFSRPPVAQTEFDPSREQFTGAVLGMALAGYRDHEGRDTFFVLPGDDVQITVPTVGMPPKAVTSSFTIVDFYESKMDLFDSAFIFVPLERLQEMRGMIDPTTGVTSVTSIQIKLKAGADGDMVCDLLRKQFGERVYNIGTWRDKQTALLKAVAFETAILNVLLFLIIAVAGFGIVAIFYMIVVEKTRDIGILKSLGASGRGVMGIFLAYGLSLGIAGSGIGMGLGLLLVYYINQIADIVGTIRGQKVFDPSVYYLQKIPTIVDPVTVAWIVVGALAIAVLASILPARRAAGLHPVEALRYE